MRYGRQRWRLRGRVEVSNKQVWDSEEYIFLPLVTELLSIKVSVMALLLLEETSQYVNMDVH